MVAMDCMKDVEIAEKCPLDSTETANLTVRSGSKCKWSRFVTIIGSLALILYFGFAFSENVKFWIRLFNNESSCLAPNAFVSSAKTCDGLKQKNILKHLRNLADIGEEMGNRAVGPGYDKCGEYVENFLISNKICSPKRQYLKVPVWTLKGEPRLSLKSQKPFKFTNLADFRVMRYGGISATVSGVVSSFPNGCDAVFSNGTIALIKDLGTCTVFDISFRAQNAGVKAILFASQKLSNARARVLDWKEGDPLIKIPVLSVTHTTRQLIESSANAPIEISIEATLELLETFNILCLIEGDSPETIVVGSHLDSVPEGPGAVDNASGSSFTLAMVELVKNPRNTVLFAWWAAEELGLLGSYHFTRCLQNGTYIGDHRIILNLNFDMLGSPNHVAYIYDGESAPEETKKMSKLITKRFAKFFDSIEKPYTLEAMIGGSDFLPFLKAGIPAGGLLTGAGEIKTMEERKLYGGLANAAMDPCYHQSCDTFENVDQTTIFKMSQAGCSVVEYFMNKKGLQQE